MKTRRRILSMMLCGAVLFAFCLPSAYASARMQDRANDSEAVQTDDDCPKIEESLSGNDIILSGTKEAAAMENIQSMSGVLTDEAKNVEENGAAINGAALLARTDYGVKVNGTQVTDANASDVLNDQTVSYDADTNTLHLNGSSLSSISNTARKELVIEAEGENTITAGDDYTNSVIDSLIESDSALIIRGTGSIKIVGKFRNGDKIGQCIKAKGDILIDGISLQLVKNPDKQGSNAIEGIVSESGGIIIRNSENIGGDIGTFLKALNGKVVISNSTYDNEMDDYSGFCSIWCKDLEFDCSTVTANAPIALTAEGDMAIRKSEVTL